MDASQFTIETLPDLAVQFKDQIKVMMGSGIRSGPGITRTLASGAEFTFLGPTFMYSVSALREQGEYVKSTIKELLEI